MALTKADLVDRIHKASDGMTKKQAAETVEAFLEKLKTSLASGVDVLLSGFGKFKVKEKRPRRGRNPQTGEEIKIDARKVVVFSPSGSLREKVNQP